MFERDLLVVPYHDWRKVQREGERTRDAHMIRHFMNSSGSRRIIIVNRPASLAECVYRRQSWITSGTVVAGTPLSRLTQIEDNAFTIDVLLPDVLGPATRHREWFFDAFSRSSLRGAVQRALRVLSVGRYDLISFNVYAAALCEQLNPASVLLDAWDNFLKFPANERHREALAGNYQRYSRIAPIWTTNSEANRSFYKQHFGVQKCEVIRNGVDVEHFQRYHRVPADLATVKRPIVGVGAKITHLFDAELLNYVVRANPDISFVHVGQVLDETVAEKIAPSDNLYMLGDKHYNDYPAYLQNFDVAIIPYVTGEREHGGDAIKFYEYIAASKPVVTTPIAGISDSLGRVAIADSPARFSELVRSMLRLGSESTDVPKKLHWAHKAAGMMSLLGEICETHEVSRTRRSVRIAFCGTRGVPAGYGGFETAVDEISRRFVDRGHHCEVFCRDTTARQRRSEHEGRRLVYVRGHRSRKLDTFVSAIQTGLHLWKHRQRYDHVFWFNNANLPGILITALAGIPMTVNTDGLEWRRAKWSWPFKAYYYLASMLIALVSRRLVSDSRAIQDYYRRRFLKKTSFIPYGAPPTTAVAPERAEAILNRFGLKAGKYFLQITRIEPDNLPLKVADAFARSRAARLGHRMVFVGYKEATPYAQRLISHDGHSGIQVREAIYDREVLHVLRSNCYCYVHGNSVGGTNPALLEAMATCPRVMAIDCQFSREVLDTCGEYFGPGDIAPTFDRMLHLPEEGEKLRSRVYGFYQWDAVAESYMRLADGHAAAYSPQAPEAVQLNRLRVTEGSR